MYYVVLLILIIFTLMELWKGDRRNILIHISFLILTIMLCLRYGQGTDYFGYMCNYDAKDFHSEIGYSFLSMICKNCGLPFEGFIALISLLQMGCLYRAIRLYSPLKMLSLLLYFPTLYLTYCFSGIRQGIVIMFFLGFMLKWLQDDKWIKYLFGCVIMSTIHSAALVLLPLIVIKRMKLKWLYWGLIGAVGIGIFIYFAPAEWFSFVEIGAVQYYIGNISISAIGLAERVVMFGILSYFIWQINKKQSNDQINLLYKIYIVGFAIAILFFPWSLLSSRMSAMMKATEILLLPILIKQGIRWKKLLVSFLILYVMVMTVKNIYSYIYQAGNEYKDYNVFTYPYFSVFEKGKVHEIRSASYRHYLWYMELYESGGLQ